MPALNFQKRFASLIEAGRKRQTIRAYRKDGRDPKSGDTLYLYTGMRTKACRKLGEVKCRSANRIQIGIDGEILSVALSRHYSPAWVTRIARADGFDGVGEMRRWFERVHGLPFKGLLVRW